MCTMLDTGSPARTSHLDLRDDDVAATTIAGLAGHACLHFQPQLDLRSGAITTTEALLRWWHPRFGLISPYASLQGTRWRGEISGLEGWSTKEACDQAARWTDDGLGIQVDLNVSAARLLRPGFVASLRAELDRSGLPAGLLSIDVPFTAFVADPRRTVQVAGELAGAGIGVVADGVPSGLRLDGLADLAADGWKIELRADRSRHDLHPTVARVVEQAHLAGATAIAKAVEDDGQLVAVRSAGFDGVFGNVISQPLSGPAVRAGFRPAPRRLPPLFGSASAVGAEEAAQGRDQLVGAGPGA
jgi:EAL domain-containing protein (putative c-di-GMP-specific phosphodiesterase class I)